MEYSAPTREVGIRLWRPATAGPKHAGRSRPPEHTAPRAGVLEGVGDRSERLRVGLAAVYGWYERNAAVAARVLRDAEVHPLTREIVELRMGPSIAAFHEVLGIKLTARQRALLQLALSFFTWRTLVRDGGLKNRAAVEAMVAVIESAEA